MGNTSLGYMEGSSQLRPNLPEIRPVTGQLGRRLDSWKEIASYLGRSEKTVRRWEEKQELPVHRLLHEKRGSVYAYAGELDAWREARKTATESSGINESHSAIVEIPKSPVKIGHLARCARLRIIGPSILLIAIAIGWFTWQRAPMRSGTATSERIPSLAVLPLENLSGDSSDEYFADGMTEELITELARMGSFRVISRTSIMRYKRTALPLPEIGRELNVKALVEGTVRRSGDRVRITVQLIRTSPEQHIWADAFEGDIRDVLNLQRDVARDIVGRIESKIGTQRVASSDSNKRLDPETYEDYLRGRYFLARRSSEAMTKAVGYFEQAVRRDPQYAQAYSGLAVAYDLLGTYAPHKWIASTSPKQG